MPEHPFAAAAEGLPKFSRRRFLAFTGSATVATPERLRRKFPLATSASTAYAWRGPCEYPSGSGSFPQPPGSLAELGTGSMPPLLRWRKPTTRSTRR